MVHRLQDSTCQYRIHPYRKKGFTALDTPGKPLGAQSLVAGTVQVNLSPDCTQLIGYCPTCGSRLKVDLESDGSHRTLVACLRCREIYRVETPAAAGDPPEEPSGFALSFGVQGCWDPSTIMEYLFDNIGTVNPVHDGFVCHPDEQHADFPTISLNSRARTVRFALFGTYPEREAGGIIHQVVSEFGTKFQLDLYPIWLERWAYGEDREGLRLVERRPVGFLLRDGTRKSAQA